MSKKDEVKALQDARDKAYLAWVNKIKNLLSDGTAREVTDENSDEELDGKPFNGLVVSSGAGFDYHVDKIRYNISHSEFKLHIVARDYEKADVWLAEYNFSVEGLDAVLESIVWEN